MAQKVSGRNNDSILQHEENGEMDRFGVDMITRVEKVPVALFPSLLRPPGSAHPRYTTMSVSKRTFALNHAGTFYLVTYLYEGFLLELPQPTYELNSATGEEPIQTHKDFESTLAGTPSAPLNAAIFLDPADNKPTEDDDAGVFERFGRGALHGVEGYRTPTATWTKIYFATVRPTELGDLGTIDTPQGPYPSFGEDRNWMLVSATYRLRGHIYEVRLTWEVSGRGGWNTLLYDP